jgi:hypothetical protein
LTKFVGPGYGTDAAKALRGLANNNYPSDLSEIRMLGNLIPSLCDNFLRHAVADHSEKRSVKQDAAVKLWLLAVLSIKRSPRHAARLAWTATRLSPESSILFMAKVANRLVTRP